MHRWGVMSPITSSITPPNPIHETLPNHPCFLGSFFINVAENCRERLTTVYFVVQLACRENQDEVSIVGYLEGFSEARDRINARTLLDDVVASEEPWRLYLSNGIQQTGIIRSLTPYMFKVEIDGAEQELHKHELEMLCPNAMAAVMEPLFDLDQRLHAQKRGPILDVSKRAPLRNTMLYICNVDKIPVEVTIIGGQRFRGLLTDFTRYEMQISFTPKLSVIVLRHAIHSMFTKDDVDLCNPRQEETRMKRMSSVWVDQ